MTQRLTQRKQTAAKANKTAQGKTAQRIASRAALG